MKKIVASLFVLLLMIAAQAPATVITSLPGGTVIPMPGIDYIGTGPVVFGPGVTWTSTDTTTFDQSVFGNTIAYSFSSNGLWTGALGPMAGLNDSHFFDGVTDTMTFAFATPVSAVGGFLNYAPDLADTPTVIAVWDSGNNLIESFTLNFSTGGGNDTGFFYGFQESSAIISSFTLTDNYIGITDLTVSSVPEPSSIILIGSGLLGVLGYCRRHTTRG